MCLSKWTFECAKAITSFIVVVPGQVIRLVSSNFGKSLSSAVVNENANFASKSTKGRLLFNDFPIDDGM